MVNVDILGPMRENAPKKMSAHGEQSLADRLFDLVSHPWPHSPQGRGNWIEENFFNTDPRWGRSSVTCRIQDGALVGFGIFPWLDLEKPQLCVAASNLATRITEHCGPPQESHAHRDDGGYVHIWTTQHRHLAIYLHSERRGHSVLEMRPSLQISIEKKEFPR